MREDIVAGIKNAYERGESMPRAIQTFINAGYNRQEVEEAARYVSSLYNSSTEQKPSYQELPKSYGIKEDIPKNLDIPVNKTGEVQNLPEHKKRGKGFILLLSTILLFLLLVLGWSAWNFITKKGIV